MTPAIDFTQPLTYRPCNTCHAPIVAGDRFPADWHLDAIKEGLLDGPVTAWATPHTPGCDAPKPDPQPGVAIRINGSRVGRLLAAPVDGSR